MAKRKPPLPAVTERAILVGVLQALAAFGIDCQRQNTGAAINPAGKLVRFGRKGNADITATIGDGPHRGKRLEIEVKRPGELPRPEQLNRMQELNRSGALAFWTNDVQATVEILQRLREGWRVEVDDDATVSVVSPDEVMGGQARA